MNPVKARRILTGYRPGDQDAGRGKFRKALKAARRSPELQSAFEAQRAFDRASAVALLSVPLPDEEDAKLKEFATAMAQSRRKSLFHDPAMVAVGVGFLLLIGVVIWHFVGQAGGFPDEAGRIASEGISHSSDEYEAVHQRAGSLGDWVALKGLDSFFIPAEFKNATVEGVRMFNVESEPVAALRAPASHMTFFVFRATPFGINIPPNTWRYGEFDQSAAAIQESDGTCFVAVMRGTREDAVNAIRNQQSENGGQ